MQERKSNYQPPLSNEELKAFREWLAERDKPRRIILGITGASGAQYGLRLLEVLTSIQNPKIETHLVASDNTNLVLQYEMGYSAEQIEQTLNQAPFRYHNRQMEAAISSGSFRTEGMIVAPCSVKTLEHIAHGSDESLIDRAAFCCLKEGRKVVLLPRETPVTKAYLLNCLKAMDSGASIVFPEPAFYHIPRTIEAIIDQTVQKVLDQFGIEANLFKRWETPAENSDD